ncbi:MAG: sulfatase-like hydrolase/transferase [Verrucomicrobiota bacterium]
MNRRFALPLCLWLLALVHLSAAPNIIVVFIDDMGYTDLSCFGGDQAVTDHIDRLADEGIKFTQFYVNSPICSPSRVALSTGQYPQRWKISSFLNHRKANQQRGMAQWLDPAAPMLARELSKAGYATGHFGKWHMGGQRDVGEAPLITRYGFDESLTNFEGLGPRILPLCDAFNGRNPRRHDLGSANLGQGPIHWKDRSIITQLFTEAAIDFIDQAAAKDQPFFVNVWPDDVHSPFFPPEVLRDQTDGSKHELYYAVLEAMDEQLAPLFERVRRDPKLRDNTLILLCSDNGHEPGAGKSAPLRGSKTWLYEGGIRSSLIVWGPGLLNPSAAGKINEESVFSAIDINRSLYAITGVQPAEELDGEDVSDTLLGKSSASRGAPLFWRRPPDRPGENGEDNPDLAMRKGQWKLLMNHGGIDTQLYDLQADPSERRNVAREKPEIVEARLPQLAAWNTALPQDASDPQFQPNRMNADTHFINPIGEGADPWVVKDPNHDRYLWCFSEGNRGIAIHTSDSLTSLGEKHVVWQAPRSGPYSRQVWAPELHWLEGRWHVYMAASDGKNENHLTYVLRSKTEDPLGEYEIHGPLTTGEGADGRSPNLWAIDMTPLEHDGQLYAVWSGWDDVGTDRQFLYIAPMKSPLELAGIRILLCANDEFPWEFTEDNGQGRGLHEGPQVLKRGERTFLTYSTGASWLPTYKLGLLELVGEDPLNPDAWAKHPKPVFESTYTTFGVGHSCFAPSPDGTEWWHIFHSKVRRAPGCQRSIFVQPMDFEENGFPIFGKPVARNHPLPLPSGTLPKSTATLPHRESFQTSSAPVGWSYFGHHQYIRFSDEGLHLGEVPQSPINQYRSGEKILFNRGIPKDFTATVTIDFLGNKTARDAGILFRTSAPTIGFDAQEGYFAGLIPRTNVLVTGKTDGTAWTELGRAKIAINASEPQTLRVTCKGPNFVFQHNGKTVLEITNPIYGSGTIGLRVVDTHAVFTNLTIID